MIPIEDFYFLLLLGLGFDVHVIGTRTLFLGHKILEQQSGKARL